MNRPFLASALVALFCAVAAAQQSSQQNPYEGQSNPPADDTIVTTDSNQPPKPPAGHPMQAQPATPVRTKAAPPHPQSSPAQAAAQAGAADSSADDSSSGDDAAAAGVVPVPGTVSSGGSAFAALPQSAPSADAGPVALAPPSYAPPAQPALYADPDGDIVHPRPLAPGEIGAGTTIRVRLLDRLSSALTERGEPFHCQVVVDVMQGGQVLIPAGTEIDGTVVSVSSGHAAGSGSMRLRPEKIILADGARYQLFAEITGTPGSNTHVVGEGTIKPDPRWKRDGIEYGGAVGAGAITGAVMAGPVGALTGSLIGAGAVTAHLLVSHPQATLDPGTTLLFTLTEPLMMGAPNATGN